MKNNILKIFVFLLLLAILVIPLKLIGVFDSEDALSGNQTEEDPGGIEEPEEPDEDEVIYYTVQVAGDILTQENVTEVKLNGVAVDFKSSYEMCKTDYLSFKLKEEVSNYSAHMNGFEFGIDNSNGFSFIILNVTADCVLDFTLTQCEHVYTESIIQASGCTGTGIKEFTCSKCSNSYRMSFYGPGHSMTYSGCIASCSVCSYSYGSHNYEYFDNPSALGNEVYYMCSNCNSTYMIECEHNYVYDQDLQFGVQYKCSKCGKIKVDG